jgi:hypothetical protein
MKLSKIIIATVSIILAITANISLAQEHFKKGVYAIETYEVQFDPNKPSQSVKLQIIDGKLILEGDIILGNVKPTRALVVDDIGKLWPNNKIYYVLPQNHPSFNDIQLAIGHINKVTNLELVARKAQNNYLNFIEGEGCSSYFGMIGGKQDVIIGACGKGGVAHEILHAAGLLHEQSRSDRDRYIKINQSNIEDGKVEQFDKRTDIASDFGQYDYGSIMHYGKTAFSKNGGNTIDILIPPASHDTEIGNREALSDKDVAAINNMYPAKPCKQQCTDGFTCWKGRCKCLGTVCLACGECVSDPRFCTEKGACK